MTEPTMQERYQHLRDNAEAFIKHMKVMVASLKERGNVEWSRNLDVWCLMQWEAALRDDASGDLWPICEVCGTPVKADADRMSSDDGCDFHISCVT